MVQRNSGPHCLFNLPNNRLCQMWKQRHITFSSLFCVPTKKSVIAWPWIMPLEAHSANSHSPSIPTFFKRLRHSWTDECNHRRIDSGGNALSKISQTMGLRQWDIKHHGVLTFLSFFCFVLLFCLLSSLVIALELFTITLEAFAIVFVNLSLFILLLLFKFGPFLNYNNYREMWKYYKRVITRYHFKVRNVFCDAKPIRCIFLQKVQSKWLSHINECVLHLFFFKTEL